MGLTRAYVEIRVPTPTVTDFDFHSLLRCVIVHISLHNGVAQRCAIVTLFTQARHHMP